MFRFFSTGRCGTSAIAALVALAPTGPAHARDFTAQQQEALGRAAGLYIGGAYFIELGTGGECAGSVPKQVSYTQSVKALMAIAPSGLKPQIESVFGKGVPDEMRRAGAEVSKELLELARKTGGGKSFFCGAMFGVGAANKMRGIQDWRAVTGATLPLLD